MCVCYVIDVPTLGDTRSGLFEILIMDVTDLENLLLLVAPHMVYEYGIRHLENLYYLPIN